MREIKPGVNVDVYDVLNAFKTGSAAIDHAVKKLLAPGQRGVKPRGQDLREAIASIERAIQIEEGFESSQRVTKGSKKARLYICAHCEKYTARHHDDPVPRNCDHCSCEDLTQERD